MAKNGLIQSAAYRAFRLEMKSGWQSVNAACGICGQRTIQYDGAPNLSDSFEMDHKISRKKARLMGRPELDMDPSNVQPSHHRCNRGKSAGDASPGLGELDEDY